MCYNNKYIKFAEHEGLYYDYGTIDENEWGALRVWTKP